MAGRPTSPADADQIITQTDSTASLGLSGAIGIGPIRLAVLGIGSAVCGSLGSLYDYQKTAEAGLTESRGLGASGMVEGVMMATMLAQPRWPVSGFRCNSFLSVHACYRAGFRGAECGTALFHSRTNSRAKYEC